MKIKLQKGLSNYIKYLDKKIDDNICKVKCSQGKEYVLYFTSKHKGRLHGEVPAVILEEIEGSHVELIPIYLYLNIDMFTKNVTIESIDHLVPLESRASILGEFVIHNNDHIEMFEDELLDFILERLHYVSTVPYVYHNRLNIEIDEYFDLNIYPEFSQNGVDSSVYVSDKSGKILYDPQISFRLDKKETMYTSFESLWEDEAAKTKIYKEAFLETLDLKTILNLIEEEQKKKEKYSFR